ncbi:ABC transporter permease subunit [Bdellovibrio sp. SKB1291214]|uniref:ABC transporter permease subunit n=1 Tax=Bdellovibrio sp. SKB1291214 TaxID=1732569 RepID=UPI0020CD821D|nr:ABC transporter permease subunit [Bdellovibrio sp. SKB1291214]UYL10241.1 ABC transporter permease subunit [Bdellovibrio sp. SKB1291214]
MMDPIEKYLIKNELTLKRYKRFKRDRIAVVSIWILLAMFFFSFTAELWANNHPHIVHYSGKTYYPLFFDYHPSEFGRDDIYVMDYRSLEMKEGDWSVWPVIQWDPYESNKSVETYPSAPTKQNWLGTDESGRDVMTRLLYGFRYTMMFAIGAWLFTYLIGITIGSVMGYMGGRVDLVGQRIVEVVESVPYLFVLITIISIFTPNIAVLAALTAVLGWTGIAAYMRAQFLSLRKREYVEAASAIGATHSRIIAKHILPNALTPIITFAPFAISANVYALSMLDYLGLGLRPPTPSWGELMAQAQKWFTIAEWLVWGPLVAIVITLILLNNIGKAVRDAFDSKM